MDYDRWECPACHYHLEYPPREDLGHACWHEAGHVVMRWARGTDNIGTVCIHPDGSGYSAVATEGLMIEAEENLLITVAGPTAEFGFLEHLDIATAVCEDFDAMRQMLTPDYLRVWLGGRCTQDEAMQYYYEWARQILWEHFDELEALANALETRGVLTAQELHDFFADEDE